MKSNMVYTIKIKDKTRKARSIINMLKALQEDYDFIEISQEQDNSDDEVLRELEVRYQSYLKNNKGKEWSTLLNEL